MHVYRVFADIIYALMNKSGESARMHIQFHTIKGQRAFANKTCTQKQKSSTWDNALMVY